MKITLENGEFYEKFIRRIKKFSEETYKFSLNIKSLNKIYTKKEMANLLLINTIIFENIYSFEYLVEKKLIHSAITCFRTFFENFRMMILFLANRDFLQAFCNNKNLEFRTVRDQDFLQVRVVKEMSKYMQEHDNDCFCEIYKNYVKGGAFSEVHSEMSKIVHLCNTNIMMLLNVEREKGIYLVVGLENLNDLAQIYITKLYEMLFILLCDYNNIFKEIFDQEIIDEIYTVEFIKECKILFDMYKKSIEYRYKE